MYLRCMIKAGVSPKETIIVEDSHIGRKAAMDSGAFLCAVKNPEDLTEDKLFPMIEKNDVQDRPK
jgi:beta-phosphoglucomutase-like phosphatase (HAD superfamily)